MKTETLFFRENASVRLDRFLVESFPAYSRSYFQRLVDGGLVLVDEVVAVKSGKKLKNGNQIIVQFAAPREIDLTPHKVDFEIVDVQPDFVVINKPAGLMVHPAESAPDEITLVHGLLHKFKELARFGESDRPGIVHRLDKDTSGLLIVARSEQARANLSQMFKDRKVKKFYKAFVHGHPEREGKVNVAIGRHPVNRRKMMCNGMAMRSALTFFSVDKYFEKHALVDVNIITGRTHQIRVHMAWLGHPIVGDAIYGQSSKQLINRQALHAYKCEFEYKGREYSYEAGMPEDIKKLQILFGLST
ncbi:RluA family pseudouridine synthase [Candidatus Babeliales bacterium]|nr:RluA family pseudouridine synthase [Candidatus Babeliales bacterium]